MMFRFYQIPVYRTDTRAHVYTGVPPYVRSVRLNTPDIQLSGVFCVAAFPTGGLHFARRFLYKKAAILDGMTAFSHFFRGVV